MPTGWTAAILEDATFEQFVWSCARAMVAFITQRDDCEDAPPELDEKPSDYHQNALVQAQAEANRLAGLSIDDWRLEWETARKRYILATEISNENKKTSKKKYELMLNKVLAWEPPSKSHHDFKRFMVDQIRDSIDFDCRSYNPTDFPNFETWPESSLARVHAEITHQIKKIKEEIDRVNDRNEWKRQLLASVPLPTR
jgi:hypothetical protein